MVDINSKSRGRASALPTFALYIDLVDPATAARTVVMSGLGFDTRPMNMAITYVGGVRHFLVALQTRLLDVPQGGAARTLFAGGGDLGRDPQFPQIVPGIAARGSAAIYSEGNQGWPVLYKFKFE